MDKISAAIAIMGGSGTLSSDFPLAAGDPCVQIIADDLQWDTPYGKSPVFRLFRLDDQNVLTLKMHGWRADVSRADASRQVFWVFREAGVQRIIAEGGVGTVNSLLDPRDFVIPDDYLDLSLRKDVGLEGRFLLVMRDALCPELRDVLLTSARKLYHGRIFDRGVYAVTEGRHFESPAEIQMMRGHADIVGQSLCPEVYLAREIGACYAGLYFVVNYGEGLVTAWSHQQLQDIFYEDAPLISRIILDAIRHISSTPACQCRQLRKETLLKEVYNKE